MKIKARAWHAWRLIVAVAPLFAAAALIYWLEAARAELVTQAVPIGAGGGPPPGNFLLIDNAGNRLLIDNAGNRLKVQ
jgi:hypothetical protein